jgi:hypothetical protein
MKKSRLPGIAAAVLALVVLVVSGVPAGAQGFRKGTFAAAGGFNFPVEESNKYFNDSGSLMFSGGRNLNKQFSLQIEWTHNWLAIDPAVLERANSDSIQFDNAHASQWSLTLNLVRKFNADKDIVPWITGGVGYYKRNLQLTQNFAVYYPPIWDPWWAGSTAAGRPARRSPAAVRPRASAGMPARASTWRSTAAPICSSTCAITKPT